MDNNPNVALNQDKTINDKYSIEGPVVRKVI